MEGGKQEGAMTYGFCPGDWPLFHSQMVKRRIDVDDIERVEMRPEGVPRSVAITVTLRSGRVEAWTQDQVEVDPLPRDRST